jgi:hypothetical protein
MTSYKIVLTDGDQVEINGANAIVNPDGHLEIHDGQGVGIAGLFKATDWVYAQRITK